MCIHSHAPMEAMVWYMPPVQFPLHLAMRIVFNSLCACSCTMSRKRLFADLGAPLQVRVAKGDFHRLRISLEKFLQA